MTVPNTFVPGTLISAAQVNQNFDAVVPTATLAASSGAAGVGFIQAGAGAVARTSQSKMRDVVSVKDYGAVGDGVTDDTVAIRAAVSAMDVYSSLYFPAGNYKVTSKIAFNPAQNNVSFFGDGASATTLTYAGATTNDDCFVFGTFGAQRAGWSISGIRFISNTVMTAGAGVHAYAINRATWRDVVFSDQDGNSNFYIGAWFDGADMVQVSQFRARGSQEGVRVNGVTGFGRADLFLHEGKISNANIGLHIAGNYGGLYVDATDIINNATNVKISREVVDIANRETFFGPGALLDSASSLKDAVTYDGINVDITDTGGFIFFDGTWMASCGTCVQVGAAFAGSLNFNGGIVFNCFDTFGGVGNGISVLGNSGTVRVNNTLFNNVDNIAIGALAGNTSVTAVHPTFDANVVTPFNNISNIVTRKGRIASGIDASPALTVTGSNINLMAYQATGTPWLSTSLSRSNTFGTHAAASGEFGGVVFSGSDGTQFKNPVSVVAYVDGVVSTNVVPSALRFKTTNASGATTAYWDIRANGTFEPVSSGVFDIGSSAKRIDTLWAENVKANGLPTYVNDAAAGVGGLVSGDFYKTATGELRIKL